MSDIEKKKNEIASRQVNDLKYSENYDTNMETISKAENLIANKSKN